MGWLTILSLLIVLVFVFLFKSNVYENKLKVDDLMNWMGVIATTVGLVVTVFFVIMAIDTFSIKNDLKKELDAFRRKRTDYETVWKDLGQPLYELLDAQIALAASSSRKSKSLLYRLYLERARFSYKYPLLDMNLRKKLFADLSYYGNLEDIAPVQGIIDNDAEPDEIKNLAREVLNAIKNRMKEEK